MNNTQVIEWQDASTSTYTAESVEIDGFTVTVCLDDEGPLRPAYYWCVEKNGEPIVSSFESTPRRARQAALRAVQS